MSGGEKALVIKIKNKKFVVKCQCQYFDTWDERYIYIYIYVCVCVCVTKILLEILQIGFY